MVGVDPNEQNRVQVQARNTCIVAPPNRYPALRRPQTRRQLKIFHWHCSRNKHRNKYVTSNCSVVNGKCRQLQYSHCYDSLSSELMLKAIPVNI